MFSPHSWVDTGKVLKRRQHRETATRAEVEWRIREWSGDCAEVETTKVKEGTYSTLEKPVVDV